MALRVWLPLTGTLENKGCSNITVTNNGATIDASGKIGSCYSFNGSTGYISLVGTQLFQIFTGGAQQFSITMWVYHADATRAILFGDYSTSGSINFNIELSTGHGVRFYWNGSPDTYPSNATVAANGWTHVTLTYNGSLLQSYINGVAKGSWSGTLGTKNKTSGEFRLGRDSRSDSTAFNGKMNDFRVYDHCLSAAEVKEISQGLVLHYKLDSSYSESTTNVGVGGWSAYTSYWTIQSQTPEKLIIKKNTASSSNTVALQNGTLKTQMTSNTIWTMSCYLYKNNIPYETTASRTTTYDGFTVLSSSHRPDGYYSVTLQVTGTAPGWIFHTDFFGSGNADGQLCEIRFLQWEQKDHATPYTPSSRTGYIQDSSGYGHNGAIGGNLNINSDTNRYSASLNFPENTSTVTIPSIFSSGQTVNNITVSCWFKTNTMNSTAPNIFSLGENSFLRCRIASATSVWGYYRVVSTACSKTYSCKTVTDNVWHLLTFSFNNGIQKMYIDGDILGTTDNTGTGTYLTCSSTAWHLAGYTANSENFLGNLSDFRIYVTTLSDADIKALYNTAAKVDNLHNMHTFEYIEGSPEIKLTKQGQFKEGEIQEDTTTKLYKTDKIIKAKQFIER